MNRWTTFVLSGFVTVALSVPAFSKALPHPQTQQNNAEHQEKKGERLEKKGERQA